MLFTFATIPFVVFIKLFWLFELFQTILQGYLAFFVVLFLSSLGQIGMSLCILERLIDILLHMSAQNDFNNDILSSSSGKVIWKETLISSHSSHVFKETAILVICKRERTAIAFLVSTESAGFHIPSDVFESENVRHFREREVLFWQLFFPGVFCQIREKSSKLFLQVKSKELFLCQFLLVLIYWLLSERRMFQIRELFVGAQIIPVYKHLS